MKIFRITLVDIIQFVAGSLVLLTQK